MRQTLTTTIRVMESDLYHRNRLFEDTSGVASSKQVSTLKTELVNPIELNAVSNFIMISTDATVELIMHQVDSSDRFNIKTNTIVLAVSAFFLCYAQFQKIVIKKIEGTKRTPKMTIIYS